MLKTLSRPLKFFDGLLDRLCAVLGAIAFSQFPQFYGQYMQRLGGHIDELRITLDAYIRVAASFNMTLEEYIREHLESGSDLFVSSGEVIQGLHLRLIKLEEAYAALQESNIYSRWFVFLKEVDWSIAAATWQDFMPGVPTTLEGLLYAGAGLLAGWGIYALTKAFSLLLLKTFRPGKKQLK